MCSNYSPGRNPTVYHMGVRLFLQRVSDNHGLSSLHSLSTPSTSDNNLAYDNCRVVDNPDAVRQPTVMVSTNWSHLYTSS